MVRVLGASWADMVAEAMAWLPLAALGGCLAHLAVVWELTCSTLASQALGGVHCPSSGSSGGGWPQALLAPEHPGFRDAGCSCATVDGPGRLCTCV